MQSAGNRQSLAWCETKSEKLRKADDPVGPNNDKYIDEAVSRADVVVVGWGQRKKFPKKYRHRDCDVMNRILKLLAMRGKKPYAFRMNGDGTPSHPGPLSRRYINDDQELIPYHCGFTQRSRWSRKSGRRE